MREDQSGRLAAVVVEFCRFLRENGVPATERQAMTALEAARSIDVLNRQTFSFALQTALCSTSEEWERFPGLFGEFWGEQRPRPQTGSLEDRQRSRKSRQRHDGNSTVLLDGPANEAAVREGDANAVFGASAQQRLKKMDFSDVPCDDLPQLEELALRLLRRMSLRLSRRLRIGNWTERVDVRRSMRRWISCGGEPLILAYKRRKPRKTRLVILLDVSGSMNFYSLFLVRFAWALQKCLARVDTFLFSTEITPVSNLLCTHHLAEALRALSQRPAGWSGGTKIGESLLQFSQEHGRRLLSRDAVFIILSDGWDTGKPELLAAQLKALKRKVSRLVWLNPLLGLKDYRPVTRGMAAALPYVDVFAPAHNLESLIALERYL